MSPLQLLQTQSSWHNRCSTVSADLGHVLAPELQGELGKRVLGTSTFYRKALLPNKSQRVEVTPKIGKVLKCQVTKQMVSVQVKSGQAR